MSNHETKPRVQLIALDLDETLLGRDGILSPENRAALEGAMGRGIQVAIATGRAYVTIPEEMRRFPGIRYAITGNGAAIYDQQTGTAIARRVLPTGAARQVLERMAREDVSFEAFLDGAAYAQADYMDRLGDFMMDEATQDYVKATRIPVPDIRAFVLAHGDELDSLAVIPRNMEVKRRAMVELRRMEKVYITTSSPRLIEINHRDCTKQKGLEYLAGILGIPRAETAAFGNADNDAEMLSWAGVGVAVADATELCLRAADHVTGPYLQDGVAQAFRDLFQIG